MNAVRGARPSCLVKMSKMQARQTSVVYSVTEPSGNSFRSSSRFLVGISKSYIQRTETTLELRVSKRRSPACHKLHLINPRFYYQLPILSEPPPMESCLTRMFKQSQHGLPSTRRH